MFLATLKALYSKHFRAYMWTSTMLYVDIYLADKSLICGHLPCTY